MNITIKPPSGLKIKDKEKIILEFLKKSWVDKMNDMLRIWIENYLQDCIEDAINNLLNWQSYTFEHFNLEFEENPSCTSYRLDSYYRDLIVTNV